MLCGDVLLIMTKCNESCLLLLTFFLKNVFNAGQIFMFGVMPNTQKLFDFISITLVAIVKGLPVPFIFSSFEVSPFSSGIWITFKILLRRLS